MAEPKGNRTKKSAADRRAEPDNEPTIPDKLYFRIGEVARLLNIAPYVLRFWESEFPQLHPNKGGTGQRLYRRRDVEMAFRIKSLLYSDGYTIPGARQLLKADTRSAHAELALQPKAPATPEDRLRKLRAELKEVADLLARPLPGTRRTPVRPEHRGLHITHRRASASRGESDSLFQAEFPKKP